MEEGDDLIDSPRRRTSEHAVEGGAAQLAWALGPEEEMTECVGRA